MAERQNMRLFTKQCLAYAKQAFPADGKHAVRKCPNNEGGGSRPIPVFAVSENVSLLIGFIRGSSKCPDALRQNHALAPYSCYVNHI